MNEIFAIWLGFLSILLIALLAIIGVVSTISNICEAVKIGDYVYLFFTFCVTVVAALVGWIIGGQLG